MKLPNAAEKEQGDFCERATVWAGEIVEVKASMGSGVGI